ncbi:MAG TPA: MOSC domain-containing protein, partial [Giesbergeria sp.]|nr:MOSC domain-containing protein [Giesbergeria sp.]
MTFDSQADLCGAVARLCVYPVKSCAGVEVQEAVLTEAGLEFDRAWMLVDDQHRFLTQRSLPRMALVRPHIDRARGLLVLQAPGQDDLAVPLAPVQGAPTLVVEVWQDQVNAWDMGDTAAYWFSTFLGQPCRMVRFDPAQRRLSSLRWTQG